MGRREGERVRERGREGEGGGGGEWEGGREGERVKERGREGEGEEEVISNKGCTAVWQLCGQYLLAVGNVNILIGHGQTPEGEEGGRERGRQDRRRRERERVTT